jgi:transposase-like protein
VVRSFNFSGMSLLTFLARFPDDASCWAHLEAIRWPQGPVCPGCGSVADSHLVGRVHYRRCNGCRRKFTVLHGTPFEGTHLPLRTWFTALYLIAASSKGVSSVKLGQHLGIGQKTAWFLGQRIRRMMEDKDGLLRGVVEVDETYMGGKRRNSRCGATPMGINQRDAAARAAKWSWPQPNAAAGRGPARARRIPSGRSSISSAEISISRGARYCVPTPCRPIVGLAASLGRICGSVNHSAGEYVWRDRHYAADAHTNTVESFNAMLKRALMGVWHWFSIKHTDRYLHELCFRWNRRKENTESRLADVFAGHAARLRWKELVA